MSASKASRLPSNPPPSQMIFYVRFICWNIGPAPREGNVEYQVFHKLLSLYPQGPSNPGCGVCFLFAPMSDVFLTFDFCPLVPPQTVQPRRKQQGENSNYFPAKLNTSRMYTRYEGFSHWSFSKVISGAENPPGLISFPMFSDEKRANCEGNLQGETVAIFTTSEY